MRELLREEHLELCGGSCEVSSWLWRSVGYFWIDSGVTSHAVTLERWGQAGHSVALEQLCCQRISLRMGQSWAPSQTHPKMGIWGKQQSLVAFCMAWDNALPLSKAACAHPKVPCPPC